MNLVTQYSIGKIMFCYAIAFEHYQNEENREKLLKTMEQVTNQYIPVDLFTINGTDVTVIRQSVRNEVYAVRQQIDSRIPRFNELLQENGLHASSETILSFLFYLIEEFLEKTNNPQRLRLWKELEEICESDPAYTGVNEAPDYMGKVENCYSEMRKEVIAAVDLVRKGVRTA